MVERGCLFWIFSKQIPGQPVLRSFLMATLPPEPGGGGRVEERGETSVGNLGSQAKQRGVLAHLLFVLFYFVFFFSFLPVLIVAACLGGRGRCSGPSLRKMTKTRPSLLPLDTSPDATPPPPSFAVRGPRTWVSPRFQKRGG